MIRMIIADDEPVIISGLKKIIEWENMGIEIIGEYADGKSAIEGILSLKPDLALLDVNMPKKTGLDVLRELREVNNQIPVVFISGYQEFRFAKEALSLGAHDYLLKPIIKEELIQSIENCVSKFYETSNSNRLNVITDDSDEIPYSKLYEIEETRYIPALVELIFDGDEDIYERRLVRFSLMSLVEKYVEKDKRGIVFTKNDHIIVIFKGLELLSAEEYICIMNDEINKKIMHKVGIVIGSEIDSMRLIANEYTKCLAMLGYFYFSGQMNRLIVQVDRKVFVRKVRFEEISECTNRIRDSIIGQDDIELQKNMNCLETLICCISNGKKDNACFQVYSVLHSIEEWFQTKGLGRVDLDMMKILDEFRSTKSYVELMEKLKEYLEKFGQHMKKSIISNEKRVFLQAVEYIENHFAENINLEVMANVVHMNASYFSTFFKKNSNMNFKEYLNKIRFDHAVTLLISTDYKVYDIAEQSGFRDARSFNELFVKYYKETPASYRKRIKKG